MCGLQFYSDKCNGEIRSCLIRILNRMCYATVCGRICLLLVNFLSRSPGATSRKRGQFSLISGDKIYTLICFQYILITGHFVRCTWLFKSEHLFVQILTAKCQVDNEVRRSEINIHDCEYLDFRYCNVVFILYEKSERDTASSSNSEKEF